MKIDRNKTVGKGHDAEVYTANFLKKHGYKIVAKNMRDEYREVDIIAVKGWTLCFIEVKAGQSVSHDSPENRVNLTKMKNITAAARHYIEKLRLLGLDPESFEIRFDVAAVKYSDNLEPEEFKYYENYYKADENELF